MITVVIGKEIEKIKGDFESYLNGLNMVGEISYSQYSELYDEGTKQIQKAYELGKAELEKELEQAKKVQVVEHFEAYGQCRDSRRIASLETENAELKDKLKNLSKVAEVRLANWQKYEKELKSEKEYSATLRKEIDEYTDSHTLCTKYKELKRENAELKEQNNKAKEIVRSLYFIIQGRIDYENNIGIADEMWRAEQFWKK